MLVLSHVRLVLDMWFPNYKLIINDPSMDGLAPDSIGSSTDFDGYFDNAEQDLCSSLPSSSSSTYMDLDAPSSSVGPSLNSHGPPTNHNSFTGQPFLYQNPASDTRSAKLLTPKTPKSASQPAFITSDKTLMHHLSYILERWGIAPDNTLILNQLSQFIINCDFFRGIKSKKVTVGLINALYPNRRKLFPFSSSTYQEGSWPENIPYKDPSHLTRELREALMIWAYGDPTHSINTLLATHANLKIRYGIVLSSQAEAALKDFRDMVAISCANR